MKLYLIQHGKALSKEENPERPLSPQGIAQTQITARYLAAKNIEVDLLWHSKKKRAVQTAEIIAEALGDRALQERDDINPLDPVGKISEEILAAGKNIMIIGHLPFLQKLAGLLLTGSEKREIVAFKNSGIVALDYDDKWTLDGLVPPEFMD